MLRKSNKSVGWNRLPMGVMVELVLTTPDFGVLCPWIMFISYRTRVASSQRTDSVLNGGESLIKHLMSKKHLR